MALSRDARLIARLRRGDVRAFDALHARHQPAVLSYCRHLTGSREDAEDAVQHAFLAAYRRIVASDDRIDLRPWLFVVARNRCLSLLRARRESAAAAVEDDGAGVLDGLADEVERRQELRSLVRDIARLPEQQRSALVLSQLDALGYREIGGVLDVTPERVKALVFQARSTLAASREAREAPCFEIRRELATARGAQLRRRLLRGHVGQCDGCREFEAAMRRQREDLALLLPVAPSAGLAASILGPAAGREGAVATAGGGAAATGGGAAATGGGAAATGGLAGLLGTIGVHGAAKLALVGAIASGGAAGAVAADLPQRMTGERAGQGSAADGGEGASPAGAVAAPPRVEGSGGVAGSPDRRDGRATGPLDAPRTQRHGDGGDVASARPAADQDAGSGPEAGGGGAEAGEHPGSQGDGAPSGGQGFGEDLPPGLARRGKVPPGLAKRDGQAPGRSGQAPGRSGQAPGPNGSPGGPGGNGHGGSNGGGGGGNGSGGGPPGGNQGSGGQGTAPQGNGGQGTPPQGNGGQGNGQGGGAGGSQGNGNASPGGQGNGGSGGSGSGGSPGGSPGNGSGGGPGGSPGNGNGGGGGGSGGKGNGGGNPH